MKEFKGMLGNWDLTDENEVASDAGYIVAAIDLVDGEKEDAYMLGASKAMFEALQSILELQTRGYVVLGDKYTDMARAAISKALGEE